MWDPLSGSFLEKKNYYLGGWRRPCNAYFACFLGPDLRAASAASFQCCPDPGQDALLVVSKESLCDYQGIADPAPFRNGGIGDVQAVA